jgi:hypothetical protein
MTKPLRRITDDKLDQLSLMIEQMNRRGFVMPTSHEGTALALREYAAAIYGTLQENYTSLITPRVMNIHRDSVLTSIDNMRTVLDRTVPVSDDLNDLVHDAAVVTAARKREDAQRYMHEEQLISVLFIVWQMIGNGYLNLTQEQATKLQSSASPINDVMHQIELDKVRQHVDFKRMRDDADRIASLWRNLADYLEKENTNDPTTRH